MKNLKKSGLIAFTFCLLAFTALAQHPHTYPTLPAINQGTFADIGGVNLIPSDSLTVTDTATYILPVTHLNDITHYLVLNWLKVGTGTATLAVNFFQANDPLYYFPVLAGKLNTAYTKSYTLAATSQKEISFARDTAAFTGRYLKIQLVTTATASVKGKYAIRLKTNIK